MSTQSTKSEKITPPPAPILAKNGSHVQRVEDVDSADADATLAALGYQPELSRNRSTLQVAFMSFVLASIPYGLSTTLYYPLIGGGPVNIIYGWILVSMFIICVALSLGEITSVFPCAGGVYYQSFMLAPPSWRRLAAWITGWFYVVGNVSITLAVNFGSASFFVACVNVFTNADGEGVFAGEPYQVYLVFLALVFICLAVCALGNRWLPWLDTFTIVLTFGGVFALVGCILGIAKEGRRSGAWALGHFESNSGWPAGWSFCVGLLHAGYATSSTGMILSMCEEVRKPSTQVPRAMVGTVILNTLCGLIFLVPLCFVLPDIVMLVNLPSGQPVPTIIKSAIGSPGGSIALLLPLMFLAINCGIGCTTATSRIVYAFARDGAMPGSSYWRKIHPRLDVPVNAMLLTTVIELMFGAIYFGSTAAFNAFSGVGVITLTCAYASPIAISLFTGRQKLETAKFKLGKVGPFVNVVALLWSLFAIPLFCMPSYVPATAVTLNWAFLVFVFAALTSAGWYLYWGKKNYAGPPITDIRF